MMLLLLLLMLFSKRWWPGYVEGVARLIIITTIFTRSTTAAQGQQIYAELCTFLQLCSMLVKASSVEDLEIESTKQLYSFLCL